MPTAARNTERDAWVSKAKRLFKQATAAQTESDRKLAHGGDFLQKFGVTLVAQRKEEDARRARSSEWLDVSLDELNEIVVDFRRAVAKGPREGPEGERHIERLRLLMETAESRIHSIKSVQAARFDEFLDEESALSNELAALGDSFAKRFTGGASDPAFAAAARPVRGGGRGATKTRRGVPRVATVAAAKTRRGDAEAEGWQAEVAGIDRDIAADGGAFGAWTRGEQEYFLQLATRFDIAGDGADDSAHVEKFLQRCDVQIPTQLPGAIRKHWKWWVAYNARGERKKVLVAAWKAKRATQRRGAARAAEKVGKQEALARSVVQQRSEAKRERRRHQEKEAVVAWREERERALAVEARDAEGAAQREIQRRRQRKADEKQRVAIYRLQKLQEDSERRRMQSMLSAAAKPPPTINSVQAKRIKGLRAGEMERARLARERRQKDTQRRLDEQRVAPAARVASTAHAAKVAAKVKRDPSRLLKATASFRTGALTKEQLAARRREEGGGAAHDSLVPSAAGARASGRPRFYGIGMSSASGRAMPSWRGQR